MVRLLAYITIAFFLLRPLDLEAQLGHRIYSMRDGLPQSDISAIAQDTLGYIWLGMFAGGIARFDGKTFEPFGTEHGLHTVEVTDVVVDNKGVLWYAEGKTIGAFDGTRFAAILNFKENRPRALLTAGDTLFFHVHLDPQWKYMVRGDTGTLARDHPLHGVLIARRMNNTEFGAFNRRTKMIVIGNGTGYRTIPAQDQFDMLWNIARTEESFVLSTNNGVYLLPQDKDALVKSGLEGILYHIDSAQGSSLILDSDNFIYQVDARGRKEKIIQANVNRAFVDREGEVWVGTQGNGLLRAFPVVFKKVDLGPRGDNVIAIRSIYIDRRGWTWAGSISHGAFKWKDNHVEHLQSGLMQYVPSVTETADGQLWIASNGGLFQYQNGRSSQIHDIVAAFSMAAGNNELVIGTVRGEVFEIKGQNVTRFESSFGKVRSIVHDRNKNRYLLCTDQGFIHFAGGQFHDSRLTDQPVNVSAYSGDSVLFLGTAGYGLMSVRDGSKQIFTKAAGLADDHIWSLAIAGHTVWIGTNNGIDRIEFTDTWTIRNIFHYGLDSGLEELETNLNSIHLNDSLLMVGTLTGLFVHRLNNVGSKAGIPEDNKVHFSRLQFMNRNHEPFDLTGESTEVPEGFDRLVFSLNQVTRRGQSDPKYSVRLLGYDSVWSPHVTQRSFDFRNLEPGKYTVEVRRQQATGWTKVLTRSFQLRSFFYQTAWFRALVVTVGLVALVALIYWVVYRKYRRALLIEQIRQQEEMRLREEIAIDFHDELGNELAKVTNTLGLLKIKNVLKGDTYDQLNYGLQRIISGTRDFIWSLDPDNDDLGSTIIHLKDFGERLFNEKEIDFSFHGAIPEGIKLPPGQADRSTSSSRKQ